MYNGVVYMYTSPSNKYYIGITIDEDRRRYSHKYYSYQNDTRFKQAINKYGFDNFKYEVLQEIQGSNKRKLIEKLKELEVEYIKKYNSYDFDYGYNMSTGGDNAEFNMQSEYDGLYGVGKTFYTRLGAKFTIIEKEDYHKRIIKFEDGYEKRVYTHNIKSGSIKHPNETDYKLGEKIYMKDGGYVKIIKKMNEKAIININDDHSEKTVYCSAIYRKEIKTTLKKFEIGNMFKFKEKTVQILHNLSKETNGKLLVKDIQTGEEIITYKKYLKEMIY